MTVTGVVLPALTMALAAWLSELTWVVTVQPAGPVATPVKVRSSAVSLWSVRLKVKVLVEGPLSCGKSVVRLTSPAAAGVTRMSSGSVAVPPEARATTSIRCVFASAVAGHGHVEAHLVAAPSPSVWTPSTTKPPPKSWRRPVRRDADGRRGRRARPMAVSIERSKLTLVPGRPRPPGTAS